ncbi:Elements of external origin [Gammaproteobacteria bacterium]
MSSKPKSKPHPTPQPDPTTLAARITNLSSLSLEELRTLWKQHFNHPYPGHANRDYLEYRLAYQIQVAALGGVPPEDRQRLAQIGQRHSKIRVRQRSEEIVLAPGTVLIREWGDREHRVTVTGEGNFEYQGRMFKSLSAVARHITGTPWSGPVFFGLKTSGEALR